MIEWRISEFVDERNIPAISAWFDSVLRNEIVREKFEAKLLMVMVGGPDLALNTLGGTKNRNIDKIRITGRVSIRVLFCRGVAGDEIILLEASREQNDKLEPYALTRAENRRDAVFADPQRRKQPYVFRKKKTP